MRRHLAYLWYVLKHKYFVFVAGMSLSVPIWQLVIHDWHKFTPSEWFPYARTFYKPNGEKQYVESESFSHAWNAHQKRGKHHWQYWLITWDHGGSDALEMPDRYRREMLADWIGAGRAITGKSDPLEWYTKNRDKMKLHPVTRRWVEVQIGYREDYSVQEVLAYVKGMIELGKPYTEVIEDALEAENAHLRLMLAACKRIASEALDGEFSRYGAELAKIAHTVDG